MEGQPGATISKAVSPYGEVQKLRVGETQSFGEKGRKKVKFGGKAPSTTNEKRVFRGRFVQYGEKK